MKVLFIGGTGVISEGCTHLAAQKGFELYLLTRGLKEVAVPEGVTLLKGDIQDWQTVNDLLQNKNFDVVVNWIAYEPAEVERDLALFASKVNQYIFISSASVYQKPLPGYIVTEETPLGNPFWEYSRLKMECETRLMKAYQEQGFPVTIVRPSYTYSYRSIPGSVGRGYTLIRRMKQGKEDHRKWRRSIIMDDYPLPGFRERFCGVNRK